ncbi:UNVERIFIED_CONTAM: hypothetical protein HDU68_005922 [Siphonaria sp. JEL0065]|nr:hypothetical protein HDU68_005922 [Siphonaria sp. JEL0065]
MDEYTANKVAQVVAAVGCTENTAEKALGLADGSVAGAITGLRARANRMQQKRAIAEVYSRAGEAKPSEGGRGFFFATDKKLKTVAWIIGGIMMLSWAAQWVAFALPYWKGDQYHHAGLFQVCGNTDFIYNPSIGDIEPGPQKAIWTCEPIEEYADRFISTFDNHTDRAATEWKSNARHAKGLFAVSRWLEALSTAADMVFGLYSLHVIINPTNDDRQNARNWYYAAAGVSLAPLLAIIDSTLCYANFSLIGIGRFNYDRQTLFWFSGDVLYIGTGLDVFLQFLFLYWGSAYQFKISKAIRVKEEQERVVLEQQQQL